MSCRHFFIPPRAFIEQITSIQLLIIVTRTRQLIEISCNARKVVINLIFNKFFNAFTGEEGAIENGKFIIRSE